MPQLSISLGSLSVEDPGGWDHVVYGEHLEAYGDPSLGGTAGGKQISMGMDEGMAAALGQADAVLSG